MSLKLSAMHTCHALMNSDDDQNVVIKSFLRQLILRGIGKASPVWSLSVQSWKYFENTVWNITDAEQWKASKLIPPPGRSYQKASTQSMLFNIWKPFEINIVQVKLERQRLHGCISTEQDPQLPAKTRPLGPRPGSRWVRGSHQNHRWERGYRRPR